MVNKDHYFLKTAFISIQILFGLSDTLFHVATCDSNPEPIANQFGENVQIVLQ